MSNDAPAVVIVWRAALLDAPDLSWPAKYTGLALATYMDADGRDAYPSVETLRKRMGVSARSVQRGLRDLAEMGFIVGTERPGRSTSYTASLPQGCLTVTPCGDQGVTVSHRGASVSHPRGDSQSPGGDSQSPEVDQEVALDVVQVTRPKQDDQHPAALVDISLKRTTEIQSLVDLLPPHEVKANTRAVLSRKFAELPAHFVAIAREELLAADGVRSRVRYLNGIADRMLNEQASRSAANPNADRYSR